MKNAKRILAVLLAAVLLCSVFAGCSPKDDGKYVIGICQLVKHVALDAATQGFIDALTEELGAENVTFDPQIAGDPSNCPTIVNAFVSKKVDLMLAVATPALQSAAAATSEIPILATAITEYGIALDRTLTDGKTGINVTGTSDLPKLDEQAAMIKEICPDIKTIGLIYCSSEPNSIYQVEEVAKYLKELGVTATLYSFTDSNDLPSVVSKAADENEALYVPTDNTAAENTGLIDAAARPKKVPVFAGEEGICKGCGIVTLSIDYYELGRQTGKMAAEILRDGKNPADMEIQYYPELTKKYNPTICEELGITVPDGYVAIAD